MLITSFLFFFAIFLGIGLYSTFKHKKNVADYLVAGRNVPAWLVGLSAVATNNSGFMFIGLIGYTYNTGLSAIWVMIGWIGGDYLAWKFGLFEKLRAYSGTIRAFTIPTVIAGVQTGENHRSWRAVQIVSATILFIFLAVYAGAQLSAGGKALHELLEWETRTGAYIGAIVVLLYSFSGGIRASIWTDAAQSIVMIIAMLTLFIVALLQFGGLAGFIKAADTISPTYLNLFPDDKAGFFWILLWIFGWFGAGFGVIGQPHIAVRAMVAKDAATVKKAQNIYFGWYWTFTFAAYLVAISARTLLDAGTGFEAELALPKLASTLLPAILTGFILAGIFAATMSTADSQILSCSAAISQDMFQGKGSYTGAKLATLFVAALALLIALEGGKSVFALVVYAWGGLTGAFAPLLFLRLRGAVVHAKEALAIMLAGFLTIPIWMEIFEWQAHVNAALPAIAMGFLTYGICLILRRK